MARAFGSDTPFLGRLLTQQAVGPPGPAGPIGPGGPQGPPGVAGSVTSIAAGTGLVATPAPITAAGSVALVVPVAVVNGGNGAGSVAGFAVAVLPAAATNKGVRTFVNNATATTFYSVVAGGGTNYVPVFSDGTAWRIG